MIRIAITAGGTQEPMDGVRFITNMSTGQLGWFCLEALLERFDQVGQNNFHIYYIHAENAFQSSLSELEKEHISFISITDAESVYQAVDELTQNEKIDFFIHSMAISDFTFSYAADVWEMGRLLTSFVTSDGKDEIKVIEQLRNPMVKFSENEKISSNDNIIVGLKPTKKVIPLIKTNNPDTVLVGFKLLNGVAEEELIRVASEMAEKNSCDMVLANDATAIGVNDHLGLLVKEGRVIERAVGKRAIAAMLATKAPF